MTILVMAGDLVVLFVGWEGVGLASYLLIGFWWSDAEKAKAGMKAFVVNRIGDAFFMVGAFLLWRTVGSLDLKVIRAFIESPDGAAQLLAPAGMFGLSLASGIALLLFMGATGKSAQIPLYVWLPDAMAGPTPVSALIHAATMVTAGICLAARLNGLFALAPDARCRRARRRVDDVSARRLDGVGADRHQEGPRVFDGVPTRVHVHRGRRERVPMRASSIS
jgi:NADH-quinone oxidoreductase subunit L